MILLKTLKRYKKALLLLACFLLVASSSASLVGYAESKESTKPVVWEFSSMLPATHYSQVPFQEFATKVEKATEGRLKFKLNWAGSLLAGPETLAAVMKGTINSGFVGTNWHPDLIPYFQVLEFPMGMLPNKPLKTVDDVRAFWLEYLKLFWRDDIEKQMSKHLESKGVKALWGSSMPPIFLYTRKPIDTTDDWKGLKTRSYSALGAEFIKAMGGAPLVLPSGEVYTSWERGLVDAGITAYSSMYGLKWFEVAKVANHWPIQGGVPFYFIVNKDAWDALPKDVWATVERVLKEMDPAKKTFELGWVSEEKAVNEFLTKYKGTIVPVSIEELRAAQEKAIPAYQKVITALRSEGKKLVEVVWGKTWSDKFMDRVLQQ